MLAEIGYKIFPFINTFLPQGFKNIDTNHPILQELEDHLMKSKQFFYAGDLIQIKKLYTSRYFKDFFGLNPEDADPSIYYASKHPDDMQRHGVARSKYIKIGIDLFHDKNGEKFISVNFRIKSNSGIYIHLLFQSYISIRTFLIQLLTRL